MGFRDVIKPLEDLDTNKEDKIVVTKVKYTIKKRGPIWCDIVDGQGKIINTKAMKVVDAEEMIKKLEE
jgi:hypothetical protein